MIEDLEEKYKCQLPLAEGSLGTLWRAEAVETGRATALAVLEPEGPDSEELCQDFLARAKVLAGLDHANVVRVFDHGMVANGSAFMAMELLEGRSLSERLADSPAITIEELVEVAEQVLSGLGAVHDAGIVHGDMEPGNIFLVARGNFFFPKIIGFGLSRAAVRRGDGVEDEGDEGLLRSLAYMSPEQARRDATIGPRSDVYSMGVVLYEAIAGKVPYRAANVAEMRQRVAAGGCKPLFRVKKEVAGALAGAVERAMAPDPDKRMPDPKSLRKALLSSLIVSPKLAKLPLPVGPRGVTTPSPDDDEPKLDAGPSSTNGPEMRASPPKVPAPAPWKPSVPGGKSGLAPRAVPVVPKPLAPAAVAPKGPLPGRTAQGGKRVTQPMAVTDIGYPAPAAAARAAVAPEEDPTSQDNDAVDDDTEERTEIKVTDLPMLAVEAPKNDPKGTRTRTLVGVAAPMPAMPKPTGVDEEELSARQIVVPSPSVPGDAEDFIATRPPPASLDGGLKPTGANGKARSGVAGAPPPSMRDAGFPPVDDLPTGDQSDALIPKRSPRQRAILTEKLPALPELVIAKDRPRGIPPGVWAGGGAFAGVVVIGVIGLLMQRPSPEPDTETAETHERVAESGGPSAETVMVMVRLSGVPTGARVEHNQRAVDGLELQVAPTSPSDTIRVTAPGCDPWETQIRPVQNEYPDARSRQFQDGTIQSVEYAVTMQCRAVPLSREQQRQERQAQQRAEQAQAQQRAEQAQAQQRAEQAQAQQRAEQAQAQQRAEQAQAQQRAEQAQAQQRAAQERAGQQRATQQRAAQQRATQQRAAQQRATQQRAAQQRATQQRAAQQRNASRPTTRGGRGRPSLARDPGF